MKNWALILICFLVCGCGTTRYVPVKEIEHVRDTVILKADTVRMTIPVEKIVEVVPAMDTLRLETSVARAMAYADTATGTLKGKIENKPYEQKKEIQHTEKIRTVEKRVEVPIEVVKWKNRIPVWVWYSLALNLLFLFILFLRIKIKLF